MTLTETQELKLLGDTYGWQKCHRFDKCANTIPDAPWIALCNECKAKVNRKINGGSVSDSDTESEQPGPWEDDELTAPWEE